MSVGRPKNKETDELENLFKIHLSQFFSDGKLPTPKNEIWSVLRDKFSVKKTNKSIYTAASRWFQNLSEDKENENINDDENVKNVSIETSLDQSMDGDANTTNTSVEQSPKANNSKKISIQISQKVWRKIAPKAISYERKREGSHKAGVRKYVSLEPGLWTNIFANEIAKHGTIPCSWVFKRNKCYLSGNKYLEFEGKCNMCSAILVGSLQKKPEEDEPVKIHIQIYNINFESHKTEAKKVKLTSKAAQKMYSKNKTATAIKRNILKESTQMFKAPTCRTMTANAIRCAQYRKRMNDKMSNCPITALSYLKSSNLFMNSIHHIGFDPFFVFYCTPEQQKLFHAFNRKNKLLKVSCDATGGLVHKIGKDFFRLK